LDFLERFDDWFLTPDGPDDGPVRITQDQLAAQLKAERRAKLAEAIAQVESMFARLDVQADAEIEMTRRKLVIERGELRQH